MGYRIALLACCLLLSCIQIGEAQIWEAQEYAPIFSYVYDVEHVVDNTFIVVGEGGMIARTEDGGQTWSMRESFVSSTLRRVKFLNSGIGWAVGAGGTILHSTDSGLSWVKIEANTTRTLRGVDFIDGDNGWIVGWFGTCLHTTDGGQTWSVEPVFTYDDLLDVEFADADRGWAVGGQHEAAIYFTEDGGSTWEEQPYDSEAGYHTTIEITSGNSACVCSNGWIVSRTENTGQEWSTRLNVEGTNGAFRDLEMLSFMDGFVCGDTRLIYRTNDGGNSWVALDVPAYEGGSRFEGIAVNSNQVGIVGGEDGVVLRTLDNGDTWELRGNDPPLYESVDFIDQSTGWCVNHNNQIFATLNGGATWDSVSSFVGPRVNKLRAKSLTDLWAVGQEGSVYNSTDAGQTWNPIQMPTSWALRDFEIRDDNIWICGDNARLYHSPDNGDTWNDHSDPFTWGWLNSIDFADDLHGFACGSGGVVIHTSDGGDTWEFSQLPSWQPLYGVDFPSALVGYAVGRDGLIGRTTDGGNTWEEYFHPTGERLNVVKFLNEDTGWVFGENGLVLHTLDGGDTWVEQAFPDNQMIRDFALQPPFGWAVTYSGIFHYTFSEAAEERPPALPRSIALTAYPNPFNPETTIRFDLPQAGPVQLRVYDVTGRLISTLMDNTLQAGTHAVTFDGSSHASGVYFISLRNRAGAQTSKVVLLK